MSKKNKEAADVQSFNRISARANILLNIMFLILALICVIPAVLVVSISFSAEQSITDYGYRLIPKIISLDGYGYLLKQGARIFSSPRWHAVLNRRRLSIIMCSSTPLPPLTSIIPTPSVSLRTTMWTASLCWDGATNRRSVF